ncbi:MAG: metallophosphoesterase [Nitrososphaerota archaeon]|nr:metallophosphoesterase [Candidatus Bathyarchaeota archaeon]MDW8194540.1 metallophosphoesterase [Nitrososphaerota archaeon]
MIRPLIPHPAALIKSGETCALAIADLHIGWEVALSEKGIHVPAQTLKLLRRLKALISTHKPNKLIILGDVKHTIATAELSEWHDVPDFFNEIRLHVKEVEVIRGNHDGNLEPLLPEDVKLLPSTGTIIGNVGLIHGHRWPPLSLLKCKTIMMGHIHPTIALRDPAGFRITRQIWVKAKCSPDKLASALTKKHEADILDIKPKTCQIFIMPSFNDFLGGKPLNEELDEEEEALGPLLRSGAFDLENAEAYLLDGTFLGTLKQLQIRKALY